MAKLKNTEKNTEDAEAAETEQVDGAPDSLAALDGAAEPAVHAGGAEDVVTTVETALQPAPPAPKKAAATAPTTQPSIARLMKFRRRSLIKR